MSRFKRSVEITEKDFEHSDTCPCCKNMHRRVFLRKVAVATAGIILPHEWAKAAVKRERTLLLRNTNTGENIKATYWTPDQGYIQDQLNRLNNFLRDHRRNLVVSMDKNMFNILNYIHANIGYERRIQVTSGYRSRETNAELAAQSGNVAKDSYHIKGKAVDILVPGMTGYQLRDIATVYNAGGVGTYVGGEYIHVDTGPVRHWRY